MKITAQQLRKIIKEEVSRIKSFQDAQDALGEALEDFADASLDRGLSVSEICELIRGEAEGMCQRLEGEQSSEEMTESEEKDVTGDGKEDFTDVMASRMMASGLPKKKAISKAEKATKKYKR